MAIYDSADFASITGPNLPQAPEADPKNRRCFMCGSTKVKAYWCGSGPTPGAHFTFICRSCATVQLAGLLADALVGSSFSDDLEVEPRLSSDLLAFEREFWRRSVIAMSHAKRQRDASKGKPRRAAKS